MRPLYLEIEGLKSILEPQSVNFEKISKSGIFGIFGKTGSGKSTILDAIVLAIYGEVTEKIDNSEFVNKCGNFTRVNLLFSTSEVGLQVKYRVERLYKFGKDKSYLTSNAKLWRITSGGEVLVCEGSADVTKKMQDEIIGLDKKDFLRCIALPQGEFAAFAKMGKSDRLKVISKLFNLEKYGEKLSQKARAKESEIKSEYDSQEKLKAELDEYSDENIKILKTDYENTEAEYKAAKIEKERADSEKNKVLPIKTLLSEQSQKLIEKEQKSAYKSIIETYVQEIKVYDDLNKISEIICGYEDKRKDLENKKHQYKTDDKELSSLKKDLENAIIEKEKIPEMRKEATEFALLKERIKSSEKSQRKLEEKDRELKVLRDEFTKLNLQSVKCDENIKNYEAEEEKFKHLVEMTDVTQLLEKLSEKMSQVAMEKFASDEIEFLSSLLNTLENTLGINAESAVYRYIGGHIEKLTAFLSVENCNVKDLLEETAKALKESGDYIAKAEKFSGLKNAETEKKNVISEKIAKLTENGKKTREEYDELKAELNKILGGKTYQSALTDAEKSEEKIENNIKSIEDKNIEIGEKMRAKELETKTLETKIHEAEKGFKQMEEKLNLALKEKEISLEKAKEVLASSDIIEVHRKVVVNYDKEISFIETRLGELNEKLSQNSLSVEEIDKICENAYIADEKFGQISENYGKIKSCYEIGLKKNQEWCIINNNIYDLKGRRDTIGRLVNLLKDGKFMEFVAGEYLGEIADDGGRRLLELTGGVYNLTYEKGNFYVLDNLRGGISRPISGLSGGETFLVSLSLALALSSQISLKALKPIDFFFLDEGFGTLDEDLIETVTDSLEKLQKANLTVGLITHVPELKNRIQSKINVIGATALHGTIIEDNCG